MSATRIDQLVANLTLWKDAYYNGPSPLVSDAVFDAAEDELRTLDPQNVYFQKIGAPNPVGGAWPKVQHSIPMGSLNKCQTSDDLKAWRPNQPVCITHKLDGASVSLKYLNGKMVQALTRGDGDIGEDITRNVLLMQGVVRQLPLAGTVYVRGEIIIRKSDFAQHFKGESNPRNSAVGTAKRQSDFDKCKHLTVVAYQFLQDGVSSKSKDLEIELLENYGFVTPPKYICVTLAGIQAVYDAYVAGKRDALDWEIDGLVLDVNDRDTREAMGDHNQRPKGSIAFKFPHEEKITTLLSIDWQVGKSGRITPVAIFQDVVLGGRTVNRASLAGVRQVEGLKLSKGCQIMVSLRNDVIPRVESNVTEGILNDM